VTEAVTCSILIADWWHGETAPFRPAAKRLTRAQRRALPQPTIQESLSREDGDVVEGVLAPERFLGYPSLMTWKRCGPDVVYRGGELGALAEEIGRWMGGAGLAEQEKDVFRRVASLALRAEADGLVLVVSPD
jgi:hypothetical protein